MAVVLLIFGILLAAYLLAAFILFQLVFRRFAPARDPWKRLTHSTDKLLAAYPEAVAGGRRFLQTHPARDVAITSFDGLTLRGKFYENAQAPENGPVLIACHGYRSSGERDFAAACQFYYGKGLSILLIDQRAAGQSQGKYITFGVKERLDVQDWCRFAAELRPGAPVLLAGISMGASSVLMAAPELPDNVAAILADCGYVSPWDELAYVVRHNAHIPATPLLRGVDLWCRLLAGFSLSQYSTVEALAENTRPVFFIHGEADDLVPCENSLKSRQACKTHTALFTVPGAGHGMSYLVDTPGYHAALEDFLRYVFPSVPQNQT